MMDKKVTRKEFLLSILSITALFAVSKIPNVITKKLSLSKSKESNTYGNYSYGGKSNV
jgi:hypothetical protein